MSEEEKKAIDEFNKLLADFKGLSKLSLWYEIDAERQNELYNKLYPLLNLIEKQQNKIDAQEMEHQYDQKMIDDLKGEMVHNWIHKDKIREKIKKYDKWILEGGDYTESLEAQRYALNELLEE